VLYPINSAVDHVVASLVDIMAPSHRPSGD
jgi:hypothetical protein